MSPQVHYAYHVTDRTGREPNWSQLSTTTDIDDYYNGAMTGLISEGVFFSTTLRDGRLPSNTLYPRNSGSDVKYWRVVVPLERFNNYRIIRCHSRRTSNNVEQVSLLLVPPSDSDLNEKVDQFKQQGEVVELTGEVNNYLYRDKLTKKWHSNNYNDFRAWVNIVVPHDVPLGEDTRWDLVKHM